MVNQVFPNESRKYYLSEYSHFDGDEYIKMYILDLNLTENSITVAVSNRGHIGYRPLTCIQATPCTSNTA